MAELVIKLVNGELAGKTAQSIAKEYNAAALAVKKAEIGTQAYVDASKKLEDVKKLQGDLKKQIDSTTAASDMLKSAWNKLPGAEFFNQTSQSLGMMKSGVGGLVSQFGVLKTAIAATGIGLLLIAVATLITIFKTFTPVVDKVEQIMSGISAVISELIQRIQNFGVGLWEVITGAPGGLDKLTGSFDGLADSIVNAYDAGVQLKKFQQDLEDAARGIEIANARAEKQVEKLIVMSKNKSASDREQIKLLQDGRKIAEEAFKREDDLQQKKLDALIMEAQTKSKLSKDEILQLTEGTLAQEVEYEKRGTIGDDLLDKIKDAQIERINSEGNTGKLLEKIQNAENARNEKIAADKQKAIEQEAKRQEKALADAKKREEELTKKREEEAKKQELARKIYYDNLKEIDDAHIAAMANGRDKDLSKLKLDLQRQIEAIDENAPFYSERVAAAQELARQKRKEINDKWDKQDLQDKFDALDLELAEEQNKLNESFLAKQLTEQEFTTLAAQNVLTTEAQRLALIKTAHGEQSAEYQRAYGEYLSLQQAQADAAVAIRKQEMKDQLAALTGSLGTFGNFFSTIASFQKQGTAQWKAFAVASAIMSTIQGAINAYTSTAAIPIVGGVLAPIAAGLALAAGYANVRKIQNTKPEAPVAKAARGAVLRGPSHANGGIPIEAEGDEIILTKGVYRDPELRAMASELNVAGGGIRFEAGGPTNPFINGATTPKTASSTTTAGSTTSASEILQVRDEVRALREVVATWPKQLRVINVVKDTMEGIETLNMIQSDADV